MRSRIILAFIAAAAFSSCSTAYKTGQTPDDVYYSPARETDAYVEVRTQDDRHYNNYQYDNPNDNWLRMRVYNRYRWSAFDDYDWNDWRYNSWTYNFHSPYAWNSYWNSYWGWNSFYNPYCTNIIVLNPKSNPSVYTKVRNFSLNSYTNTNYNNSNANISRLKTTYRGLPGPGYNNSNSPSLGTSIRKVFSGSNSTSSYNKGNYNVPSNNTPSSGDRPSRSYSPSTTPSSSGSSGGGSTGGSSGGSVSRPGRGG